MGERTVIPSRSFFVCDRCGAEVEQFTRTRGTTGNLIRWSKTADEVQQTHIDYDLCDACDVHLDAFLNGEAVAPLANG